ncbi:MAG TPA: hypothetical protein VFG32_08875 [Bacteroidota bacterium]|nr:hypothetical protein [Bacteroidota bacterium]
MARRKLRRLVTSNLERISSKVFDEYHDEITQLVGRRHGVYSLYKRERLYYVGLAKDLRSRLDGHLKDKHASKWDSFSLYLIRNVNYLRELESLIIHVADPKANIHKGRFARSTNLRSTLEELMEERDRAKRAEILAGHSRKKKKRRRRRSRQRKTSGRRANLAGLLSSGTELRARYRKKEYVASVDGTGRISIDDKTFSSPSAAGSFVRNGKATDGWMFWTYKNEVSKWVKIDELRSKQP